MFYIIYSCLMLLFFLFYKVMVKNNRKIEANFSPDAFIITQPKFIMGIGISVAVIFLALTILAVIFPKTAEWWVYPFFIASSLIGVLLAYYCKMYYIIVSEDIITYNSVIRKPQSFKSEDITKIKKHIDGISVYCGKERIFKIETNCVGYSVFIKWLENKNLINSIQKLSQTSHF